MSGQIVNSVITEVTAETEGLRAQLQVAEGYIKQLEGKTTASGVAATQAGQKYGQAAQRIASVGEAAARAGEVGAQGAKQLITSASSIAFAFGPQGAIVGAIGIATLAVVQFFTRTSDEAKKTKETLERLREDAAARRSREQPVAVAEEGLNAARKEEARIRAQIAKREQDPDLAFSGKESALVRLTRELAAATAERTEAERQLTEAKKAQADATAAAADREVQALSALLASGTATNAERERARTIIAETRAELTSLAESGRIDADALALRARLTERLTALTKSQTTAAKEAQREAEQIREQRLRDANRALDQHVADQKKAQETIQALERQSAKKLAEVMGDAVSVLKIEIAETVAELERLGATDAEIQRIIAPLNAAAKAAEELKGAAAKIEISADLKEKLTTPLQKITQEIDKLREKLKRAGASEDEIARATTARAVERLTALFVEQGFTLDDARAKAQAYVRGLQRVDAAARDVAQQVTQIGQALISVAGALGVVDQRTQSIARGAINVGVGLASGNPLQIVAGIGDLIQGIASGNEEAKRHHAEALQALEGIRKNTGDLLGKNVTGNQARDARTAAAVALGTSGRDPAEFFFKVVQQLENLGIRFENVMVVAKAFGVTLNATRQSWVDLKKAMDEIDLKALRDTFDGALTVAEQARRIFGQDGTASQLVDTARILARFSPEFAKVFEGLDLTKAEDRAIAMQRIAEAWAKALAGTADLGDLNPGQFLDFAIGIAEWIRSLAPIIAATEPLFDKAADKLSRFQKSMDAFTKGVDRRIALEDIEDPLEQFRVRASGFASAFPGLKDFFDQFDFSTVEGVRAFGAALPDLIKGLEDGSIVIEGVSKDDLPGLIAALLGLESAGDAAEGALLSLADQIANVFQDIDLDALVFGEEFTDTVRKKLDAFFGSDAFADKLGLKGVLDPKQFDLTTQEGRDAARAALREAYKTADPATKKIIAQLIQDLDRLPEIIGEEVGEAVGGAVGAGGAAGGSTTHAGSLQQMTLFQGDRLITIAETQLLRLTEIRADLAAAVRSMLAPLPAIVAPEIPGFGASFASGGGRAVHIQIGPIVVPPGTDDPQAFGQAVGNATMNELLADALFRERFFAGNNRVT